MRDSRKALEPAALRGIAVSFPLALGRAVAVALGHALAVALAVDLVVALAVGLGLPRGKVLAAAEEIRGFPTDVAAFVGLAVRGPLDEPTAVESTDEFLQLFGGADASLSSPWLAPSVAAFFANGGRRAWIVRVASDADAAYIGRPDGAGGRPTGIQSLREVDEVAIVCAPGVSSHAVQAALLRLAEGTGDRVAILDPEPAASPEDVLLQRAGLESAGGFGALYYPWVVADPVLVEPPVAEPGALPGGLLPPSGFVAGVWARTDREAGVWKAPVGEVRGALGASVDLSSADQEPLNLAGVSALRSFPGSGLQVWGARTVSSDPEWKYVNVRRYFLYLEESIGRGTSWAVFEPNDEPLWAELRSSVESFLLSQWRAGALPGMKPEEAFFVRVDRSTMTQADIDARRTVILAGAAAVRPAEFTVLRVAIERPAGARFLRGDANGDGAVDISDPLRILGHLFLGDPAPPCPAAADAADEGEITISSAVRILGFLFLGGPPPAPPFPSCGVDPTPDRLGCGSSC